MDNLEAQNDEMTPAQWALAAFGVLTLLGVVLMVVKLSVLSFGVFLVGAIGATAMTFQHWKANVFGAAERANQWATDRLAERAETRATTATTANRSREQVQPPPMRSSDSDTGDRIYWTGRPSFFRMRPFYSLLAMLCVAAGLGFILAGATSTDGRGWKFAVGIILTGIAAVDWFRAMLVVWSAYYMVLGERAYARVGLFSKYTIETRHKDVRSVEVDQSLLQRIFGCGTVRISSAAGPGDEVVFLGIAHPHAVASLLRRLQDAT